jgi:phosphate transport system protein
MMERELGQGETMIRHIDSELQELKDMVLQMGGFVEKAMDSAATAIIKFSSSAMAEVQSYEAKINELQIKIDEACISLLAKQAPVVRDLRLVFAIVKINTDLERMGDQACNIALTAADFAKSSPAIPSNLRLMIDEVKGMVRSALDAFSRQDVNLAQEVLTRDDEIDDLKDSLVHENSTKMENDSKFVEVGLCLINMARNLERLADHATNIAEEVIFLATGADVRHGHSIGMG